MAPLMADRAGSWIRSRAARQLCPGMIEQQSPPVAARSSWLTAVLLQPSAAGSLPCQLHTRGGAGQLHHPLHIPLDRTSAQSCLRRDRLVAKACHEQ